MPRGSDAIRQGQASRTHSNDRAVRAVPPQHCELPRRDLRSHRLAVDGLRVLPQWRDRPGYVGLRTTHSAHVEPTLREVPLDDGGSRNVQSGELEDGRDEACRPAGDGLCCLPQRHARQRHFGCAAAPHHDGAAMRAVPCGSCDGRGHGPGKLESGRDEPCRDYNGVRQLPQRPVHQCEEAGGLPTPHHDHPALRDVPQEHRELRQYRDEPCRPFRDGLRLLPQRHQRSGYFNLRHPHHDGPAV